MKTLFKKSMVALALAGLSVGAQAATVANSEIKLGKEGLTTSTGTGSNIAVSNADVANAVDVFKTGAFSITTAQEIPVGGLIRIQSNTNFAKGGSSSFAYTATAPAVTNEVGGATLSVANSGDNFVTFRVATNALDNGATLTFDGATALKYLAKDVLASGSVKIEFIAEDNLGAQLEKVETTLLEVVDQEKFAIKTKISGKIDVAQARQKFETGTGGEFEVEKTSNTVNGYAVTYINQKFELGGDFSWIKDQNTTTDNIQAATDVVKLTNATLNSITPSKITFTATGTATPKVEFDVSKNTAAAPDAGTGVTLARTDFVVTSEVDYNNAAGLASNKAKPFDGVSAGSWTLNGSTVTVPYMVFGTVGSKSFGQVVTVTNNSKVEGTVYVDAWAADGTQLLNNKAMPTKSKAFSSTAYASEILAALGGSYNGRVSLKITTEAPEDSVQVYAAYTDAATTERAIVVGLKKD